MVTAALVDSMIEAGRTLLVWLDKAGLRVEAALWLYDSDAEEWRLVLSSSAPELTTPKTAYGAVQQVVWALNDPLISLSIISIRFLNDPMIKALRDAFRQDSDVKGLRLNTTVIGNVYVEDAYIYRLHGGQRAPADARAAGG